jgi:16S rRNA (cytidine1402-2'-O)-methyltransferase
MLILAATPIGNLGDASTRLRSTLEGASHIAAEDTRTLKSLAGLLGLKLTAQLISLHEHNESEKLDRLVQLALDGDLVLVSDAGMPTISDPGYLLVRACAEAGVEIQVIPGPSAVISALAVSGLATDRFSFEGFLPRKSGERKKLFSELASEKRTQVFFDSPHRISDSLKDAISCYGPNRKASISRELTKKFEETKRGSLEELLEWSREIKGELVLVIAGSPQPDIEPDDLVPEVLELISQGLGLKQASSQVAKAHGVSASRLYDLALKSK